MQWTAIIETPQALRRRSTIAFICPRLLRLHNDCWVVPEGLRAVENSAMSFMYTSRLVGLKGCGQQRQLCIGHLETVLDSLEFNWHGLDTAEYEKDDERFWIRKREMEGRSYPSTSDHQVI